MHYPSNSPNKNHTNTNVPLVDSLQNEWETKKCTFMCKERLHDGCKMPLKIPQNSSNISKRLLLPKVPLALKLPYVTHQIYDVIALVSHLVYPVLPFSLAKNKSRDGVSSDWSKCCSHLHFRYLIFFLKIT